MTSVGMASRPAVSKGGWLSRMLGRLAPPVPSVLSQRSLMSQRPQRAGLGRRLWPRQRHFGHVNVQIVDKTGMKGPLAWPKRRCRGQGDGGVAKETLARSKRSRPGANRIDHGGFCRQPIAALDA